MTDAARQTKRALERVRKNTTQQPEHCEHECYYKKNILNDRCNIPRCQYDTRTRPHTQTPRPPCEECHYQERIDAAERKAQAATLALIEELLKMEVTDCDVGGSCCLIQKLLSIRQQVGEQE